MSLQKKEASQYGIKRQSYYRDFMAESQQSAKSINPIIKPQMKPEITKADSKLKQQEQTKSKLNVIKLDSKDKQISERQVIAKKITEKYNQLKSDELIKQLEDGQLSENECKTLLSKPVNTEDFIKLNMNLRTEQKEKAILEEENKVTTEENKQLNTQNKMLNSEIERLKQIIASKNKQIESQ